MSSRGRRGRSLGLMAASPVRLPRSLAATAAAGVRSMTGIRIPDHAMGQSALFLCPTHLQAEIAMTTDQTSRLTHAADRFLGKDPSALTDQERIILQQA